MSRIVEKRIMFLREKWLYQYSLVNGDILSRAMAPWHSRGVLIVKALDIAAEMSEYVRVNIVAVCRMLDDIDATNIANATKG